MDASPTYCQAYKQNITGPEFVSRHNLPKSTPSNSRILVN
jgi:hypothetical protein